MTWGIGRVLRDRDAGLYLGGVLVSQFGNSAMALAAGVWAKELTGSDSVAALTTLCVWLPTLAGPVIGTLADRTRRRALLVALNLGMVPVMLALLAVGGREELWLLFAALLAYGATSVLGDAAEAGLVVAVVPKPLRGDFNGLRMTANEAQKLVAPLLGAALFAGLGGHSVAVLNAVTFALAAGAFALIRTPDPRPARAGGAQPWTRRTASGMTHLWRVPALRRLTTASALTMGLAGVNGALPYAVVDDGLGRAPTFVAVLAAVQGAGSVASGLASGALLRRMPEQVYAAAGTALFALGTAALTLPWEPGVLAGSLAIGAGLPCVLVAAMTAVQRETPEERLGAVAASAGTALFAPNVLGLGIGAGLVAVTGHRVVLAVLAVCGLAVAAWCARPSTRRAL